MDLQNPTKGRKATAVLALAAAALVSATWSTAALGRTQTESECDRMVRDLEALDKPAMELAVRAVDHVAIKSDASALDASDLDSKADETATPLLRFAPRVSSALKDVFGEGGVTEVEEAILEIPASPIAETEDIKDVSESLPDESIPVHQPEEGIDSPLLQRRMYRTDI